MKWFQSSSTDPRSRWTFIDSFKSDKRPKWSEGFCRNSKTHSIFKSKTMRKVTRHFYYWICGMGGLVIGAGLSAARKIHQEGHIVVVFEKTIILEVRGSWRGRHATRSSVRELLPCIYLELAILPCWRFLLDKPMDSLQHLVKMTRGLADPVASAYCRLYMAHCAQKLPSRDIGTFYFIS